MGSIFCEMLRNIVWRRGMGEEEFHIRDGKIEVYTGRDAVVTVPAGIHTIGKGADRKSVV